MYMDLKVIAEIAIPLCRQFDVKVLYIFGSFARGDNTHDSDIDLLVEFNNPEDSPADRFFGLLHALEDATHLNIDLLTMTGLRNPYFKKRVMSEKVALYEEENNPFNNLNETTNHADRHGSLLN